LSVVGESLWSTHQSVALDREVVSMVAPCRHHLDMSGLQRTAVVAVVYALLAVGECGSAARATFPGTNGRIAFDAANSQDLTAQAYTVDAAGRDLHWVSDVGMNPAFSADGRAIAWSVGGTFTGGRGARVRFTRQLHRDFPRGRSLTHPGKGQGDFLPTWSPDSRRVAFVRCFRCDRPRRTRRIIYTVGLDHRRTTRLGPGTWPAWSVGGEIAFTRGGDLYATNADGLSPRRVTSGEPQDGSPDWSPDGLQIVFDRDGDVYTVPQTGGAVARLTTDGHSRSPTFSPDGQNILYVSDGSLRLMSAEGGPSARLRTPGCVPPGCLAIGGSDWQPLQPSAAALVRTGLDIVGQMALGAALLSAATIMLRSPLRRRTAARKLASTTGEEPRLGERGSCQIGCSVARQAPSTQASATALREMREPLGEKF
jgi:Tol biopolymer transport system component